MPLRPLPSAAALVIAAAVALPIPAHAITGRQPILRDPRLYQRTYEPAVQRAHGSRGEWTDFLLRHGPRWTARWDARSHTALRFYGEGIEVGQPTTDEEAFAIGETFFYDNEDLLGDGVLVEDLVRISAKEAHGTRYVSFRREYRGVPVEGSRVHVRIKNGRLFMGGVDTHPDADVPTSPAIPFEAAVEVARGDLSTLAPRDRLTAEGDVELVVYPLPLEDRYEYHLAWKVRMVREDGPGTWDVFVDATDGSLVDRLDRVLWLDGTLNVRHDLRTVTNPPEYGVTPMAFNKVTFPDPDPDVTVYTDAGGHFVADGVAGPTTATASVVGDDIRISNFSQGNAEIAGSWTAADGAALEFSTDAATDEYGQAQLDVYAYLLQVRARAQAMDPANAYAWDRIDAKVNQDQTCNAFFDGDVNFFRSGGGCNNTGRISDVVYHEFGHGFHYYQLTQGDVGVFDGALSEGAGDYMSGTMWGDPYLAPGFFVSGASTWLREFDSDYSWPDDIDADPHYTGLIFASTMWDLQTLLAGKYGVDAGRAHADLLYARILIGAMDIPTTYEEALAGDDDDGNLANGTPNVCEINDAFSAHGLGPSGGAAGISTAHAPLGNQASGAEIPVSAFVAIQYPQCVEYGIESTRLSWSVDAGSNWETSDMVGDDGENWTATLPALPAGTQVLYSIEIADGGGNAAYTLPENAAMPYYMFYVGELAPVFFDDFEGDDMGWTHELLSGDDEEGADDWQQGRPRGESGDPSEAFSGSIVWGNDLGSNQYNGAYQPDKVNTLISPPIDLSSHSLVRLQFRRWLLVEDGSFDRAAVYVEEQPVWTNAVSPSSVPDDERDLHHEDLEWQLHDIDISGIAGGRPDVRIRFEIDSDGGLEFGGWNVDDVGVYAMTEAPEDPPGDDDDDDGDDDTTDPSGEDPEGPSLIGDPDTCGGCDASDSSQSSPVGAALAAFALLALRRRLR